MAFAYVREVGPTILSDHFENYANILQVICKNLQVQSRNLQVNPFLRNIKISKGGPTSCSPPTYRYKLENDIKIFLVICKNLQVHSRNLQVTETATISIQSSELSPPKFRYKLENDINIFLVNTLVMSQLLTSQHYYFCFM